MAPEVDYLEQLSNQILNLYKYPPEIIKDAQEVEKKYFS